MERPKVLLRRSGLTGTVYVITRWKDLPNGSIEAQIKHDVTDQFEALVREVESAVPHDVERGE